MTLPTESRRQFPPLPVWGARTTNGHPAHGVVVEVDGRIGPEWWTGYVRNTRRDRARLASARMTAGVYRGCLWFCP
jgi:hypothetical protein